MKRSKVQQQDAFMKLAAGGLSVEEKKASNKVVLEKLTEDECNGLIQNMAKLGLK